ncbi:hypothetical protein Hanom_Chr03g00217391 [Helianthus anomalus]
MFTSVCHCKRVTYSCFWFVVEPVEETFSFFEARSPPPPRDAAADTGVNKEFTRSPSIEVVTSPSVHAEDTGKMAARQTIFDTKTPAAEKTSRSTTAGTGFEEPSIQPGESELEFYYRSYAEDRSVSYHRPPWNIMKGDDISNDPSACRDILSGLGTPFEVLRAHGLPRENQINQLCSMLVGSSIMASAIIEDYKVLGRKEEETARLWAEAEALVKAAREEQLERERRLLLRGTSRLKLGPRLPALNREACARENEKLLHVRQEMTNLKAANTVLVKEKAAAEAAAKEAKEAEARGAKALEMADDDRKNLNKVVEDLKVWTTIILESASFPLKVYN